jgi:hypothetical protein
MPQPTIGDVNVDRALTNVAIQFQPRGLIAETVFPVVGVQQETGRYAVWNEPEWFRDEALRTAPGARAPRGGMDLTWATYSCEEWKFATVLPDRIARNAESALQLPVAKAKYATAKVLLAKEVRVALLCQTASNWGGSATPTTKWDAPNATPLADLEAAKEQVVKATGYVPNTVVVPYQVIRAIKARTDNDIYDKVKYTQKGLVTGDLLASLLDVERVLIPQAIKCTTAEGAPPSYDWVWTDTVWVGYVTSSPSVTDPSAGYQFRVGTRRIRTYREPAEEQTVYEAAELVDEKVTSSVLGYVLTDVLT